MSLPLPIRVALRRLLLRLAGWAAAASLPRTTRRTIPAILEVADVRLRRAGLDAINGQAVEEILRRSVEEATGQPASVEDVAGVVALFDVVRMAGGRP